MSISFKKVESSQFDEFAKDVKEAFSKAVIEEFGQLEEEIITIEDARKSLEDEMAENYYIYDDDKKVGGTVLIIDNQTKINSLDTFFIYDNCTSKGIGLQAWKAIEKLHPETIKWQAVTPYFEKRNIHFYVNKCGFKITKFFNPHHKSNPDRKDHGNFKDEFFLFEKEM